MPHFISVLNSFNHIPQWYEVSDCYTSQNTSQKLERVTNEQEMDSHPTEIFDISKHFPALNQDKNQSKNWGKIGLECSFKFCNLTTLHFSFSHFNFALQFFESANRKFLFQTVVLKYCSSAFLKYCVWKSVLKPSFSYEQLGFENFSFSLRNEKIS